MYTHFFWYWNRYLLDCHTGTGTGTGPGTPVAVPVLVRRSGPVRQCPSLRTVTDGRAIRSTPCVELDPCGRAARDNACGCSASWPLPPSLRCLVPCPSWLASASGRMRLSFVLTVLGAVTCKNRGEVRHMICCCFCLNPPPLPPPLGRCHSSEETAAAVRSCSPYSPSPYETNSAFGTHSACVTKPPGGGGHDDSVGAGFDGGVPPSAPATAATSATAPL